MSLSVHKPHHENHPISWFFSRLDCTIAEVESRAGKPALPRRSNVADCNGKEKDWESGFHYYGARYYWSELLTGWLSVDPMLDKYPGISPYAYCVSNPVRIVDPDGMDSVHTPNGIANAGEGYRTSPDGMYLYGEGLQTKKWNPDLELGGVVGCNLQGGYEDCDISELPITNNVAASPIAIPISAPVVFTGTGILSEVVEVLGVATLRLMGVLSGCFLLSGDTHPTQEMSQHGGTM